MGLSSGELIRRWRKRRMEILRALPPDLLAEYRRLGKNIAEVRQEETRAKEPPVEPMRMGFHGPLPPPRRRSLLFHKAKLIRFLERHGPATRKEIALETGIPAGSLSELLKQASFEKHRWGIWALKGQGKQPGTSAPPRSEKPT